MKRSVFAVCVVVALAAPSTAEGPKAEALVPFEKLEVELRNELWKVCQRYTVRRKVDEQSIKCPVETYEWLIEHLPLSSTAAREMGLGKYVIEEKGDKTFSIDDTDGAFANCEKVFSEKGRLVVVARGTVEGTLLPKTKGTGVIIVKYREDPQDKEKTLTEAFVFFRVANEVLHKATAPFRDALGRILGSKIDGVIECAAKVSAETQKDPQKVADALEKRKFSSEGIDAFKKKFLLH